MSGMVLDRREFDAAIIQYAAASGKDFQDIVNKKLYDASLRSIKHVKTADKPAISALRNEEKLIWWFARKTYIPRGMNKSEAYEAAKKLISRRGKSVGFLKSFFFKMASVMAPFVRDLKWSSGSRSKGVFAGFVPFVRPATRTNLNGEIGVAYTYQTRKGTTAQTAEKILYRALQGGIADAAADMMIYARRKMGLTAAKYSAKGAR